MNMLSTILPMRGCLCDICKREVGNLSNVRLREVGLSHKNTLCVPSYCVGQVRGGGDRGGGGVGRLIIAV